MGRRREWAPEELIRLVEAYVATTLNLIVATNQTSFNFAGKALQGVRDRIPKYQDRDKFPVKSKLTVVALDALKFNGSLLEVCTVMLTGVTGDEIFRIAVARHFGKFKPSSNVPFDADM
jgi:hypothetical protein